MLFGDFCMACQSKLEVRQKKDDQGGYSQELYCPGCDKVMLELTSFQDMKDWKPDEKDNK